MPWFKDASGRPVWQDGGGVTLPAPAKAQYEGPQAAATLGKTTADIAATNANTAATERRTTLDADKEARSRRQYPISKDDAAFINSMREQTAGMGELLGKLGTATSAIDRFQPSPERGSLYNNFFPGDDDGLITTGGKAIGRAFLPDQSERDYETLRAMQESAVLKTQEAQKGPQTEADAARMKASTISPSKGTSTNALLVAESIYNAKMAEAKPDFFTKWANNFGSLSALDRNGNSVDKAWAKAYQGGFNKLKNDPRYKRLIGGGKAKRPARVAPTDDIIDLDDL